MNEFEKWVKDRFFSDYHPVMDTDVSYLDMEAAWQEATKQRDALHKLADKHTRESIRENAILGEREKIVKMLRKEAHSHYGHPQDFPTKIYIEIADLIEQENK